MTVVGDPACSDDELENRVRAQLSEWFDSQSEGEGPQGQGASSDVSEGNGAPESSARAKRVAVEDWKHLRTYRVPYAQPAQKPPVGEGGFYGRSVEVSSPLRQHDNRGSQGGGVGDNALLSPRMLMSYGTRYSTLEIHLHSLVHPREGICSHLARKAIA